MSRPSAADLRLIEVDATHDAGAMSGRVLALLSAYRDLLGQADAAWDVGFAAGTDYALDAAEALQAGSAGPTRPPNPYAPGSGGASDDVEAHESTATDEDGPDEDGLGEALDQVGEAVAAMSCPYYRGHGTCAGGCHSEPRCQTGAPEHGWAQQMLDGALAVSVVAGRHRRPASTPPTSQQDR